MIIRRSSQLKTKLLDQDNFYLAFHSDIRAAKHEVIIESPFLTLRRLKLLLPDMLRVKARGVRLVINTKPINEQDVNCSTERRNSLPEGVVIFLCLVKLPLSRTLVLNLAELG